MVELKKMQNDSNYVSNWEPASRDTGSHEPGKTLAPERTVDLLGAEIRPNRPERSTVKRAEQVINDYFAAGKDPLRGDEILGSRKHDSYFEMGDGERGAPDHRGSNCCRYGFGKDRGHISGIALCVSNDDRAGRGGHRAQKGDRRGNAGKGIRGFSQPTVRTGSTPAKSSR